MESALDVKLGTHLCELQKVALWCFLEPDTCEGENSLLSTCGELRAPLRALNLKPFKPSIGQRAFPELISKHEENALPGLSPSYDL